jgi:hypothetical protein
VQRESLPGQDNPWVGAVVLACAVCLAAVTARDHAGAWNDGSRLATVECLVDHGTLAIDNSIFVQVPEGPEAASPYPPDDILLRQRGTCDKLLIDGRFYSDKSPVPALLLAGIYRTWQWSTGLTARERPDLFCLVLTWASSGLAYVVAVWCVYRVGRPLGLDLSLRLLLTGSFALATVALPYAAYVNNHILLLGVCAALMLGVARLGEARQQGQTPWGWLIGLGSLGGLGYAIDLGAGPVILACTGLLVAGRCRRVAPVALFTVAALPWLVLHHAVNYAVGGTLEPANAVAEYFNWAGSPFTAQNLTGGWKHPGPVRFLLYSADLLVGKRGFLGHNLALFLLPVLGMLERRRTAGWPEVLHAAFCCCGVWLIYAVNSNNSSGQCLSVRWFVPLLAPGYYLLAVCLRDYPCWRTDLLILSGWGAVMAGLGWWYGPWIKHMLPLYWPLQAAALLSWGGYRIHLWRQGRPWLPDMSRHGVARVCRPHPRALLPTPDGVAQETV